MDDGKPIFKQAMESSMPKGNQRLNTNSSTYNALDFLVNQKLLEVNTCELVKVVSVAGGFVDVQPMVLSLDGDDKPLTNAVNYHLPYLRVQGGANGIICNPSVGDVGLVCYCQRDITNVLNSKGTNVPNTARSFDASDGVYVLSVASLNGAPSRFIEFTDKGITITANTMLTINGDVTVNGKITATGDIIGGNISLDNHTHDFTGVGAGNAGTTQKPK